MLRTVLNKIFSSRVFYILFSLLASIALWMYVEINVNTEMQHPVNNVEIRYKNKEVLSDRGLLISSISPETVNLTFDVQRSVATKLKRDTVYVEVDLANVTSTGTAWLGYEIILPTGVDKSAISHVMPSVDLTPP